MFLLLLILSDTALGARNTFFTAIYPDLGFPILAAVDLVGGDSGSQLSAPIMLHFSRGVGRYEFLLVSRIVPIALRRFVFVDVDWWALDFIRRTLHIWWQILLVERLLTGKIMFLCLA